MPQQMIWLYTCSLCKAETYDQDKNAEYQITGPNGTLAYDLCPACEGSDDFRILLTAGIPIKGSKKAKPKAPKPLVLATEEPDEKPCEYCGEMFTATGMGLHQSKQHNVKSKTQILQETRGKAGDHPCTERGCDFVAQNPQGLGAHKRVKHGISGTSKEAARRGALKGRATK